MEPKIENKTKSIGIREAIESEAIPYNVRKALREWWEWYDMRYAIPIELEIDNDYIALYISYDITEEVEACTKVGVRRAIEEDWYPDLTEEEIEEGIYDACREDSIDDTIDVFNDVRRHLLKCLDKYGIRYTWEDSWEGDTKYLNVVIKF